MGFDQLCVAFGEEVTNSTLLPSLVTLLKDNEQEVRTEAVKAIEACLVVKPPQINSDQFHTHFFPQFDQLRVDPAQPVRAALAALIGPVTQLVERDMIQKELLSLICDLMKDESHHVRLSIVSHVGLISEVLGLESLVQHLLLTIQNLIVDNHWRIRQSVVEQVPKLAQLFGVEMFQAQLETLFLSSLRDSVHAVRQAAVGQFREITETFGASWTVDHLLPKLLAEYSQVTGYAARITTLHVLPQVSLVMSPEQVSQCIFPVLIKATKDPVPNVRFIACSTIKLMLENKKLGAAIRPTLEELQTDSDIDVQYYAQMALI